MPASTTTRSSSPKSARKGSTSGRSRRRSRRSKSGLAALLELAVLTFWGRVILIMLITAALAAVNLLISGNRFDLFFQMTGIEMVLVAVIFWIRFMMRKN